MTAFAINKPVKTATPTVTVDAGLKPGVHRFRLEVLTHDDRRSQPMTVVVKVTEARDPTRPVRPPIDVLRPREPVVRDTTRERIAPIAPTRPLRPIRRPGPGDRDPSE